MYFKETLRLGTAQYAKGLQLYGRVGEGRGKEVQKPAEERKREAEEANRIRVAPGVAVGRRVDGIVPRTPEVALAAPRGKSENPEGSVCLMYHTCYAFMCKCEVVAIRRGDWMRLWLALNGTLPSECPASFCARVCTVPNVPVCTTHLLYLLVTCASRLCSLAPLFFFFFSFLSCLCRSGLLFAF